MSKPKDSVPVFDRSRTWREDRDLRKALEYAAGFEPETYHDAEPALEGFQEWDGDPEPEFVESDDDWTDYEDEDQEVTE